MSQRRQIQRDGVVIGREQRRRRRLAVVGRPLSRRRRRRRDCSNDITRGGGDGRARRGGRVPRNSSRDPVPDRSRRGGDRGSSGSQRPVGGSQQRDVGRLAIATGEQVALTATKLGPSVLEPHLNTINTSL